MASIEFWMNNNLLEWKYEYSIYKKIYKYGDKLFCLYVHFIMYIYKWIDTKAENLIQYWKYCFNDCDICHKL